MIINPGEEFRNVATPSREVLRKLVYLAEIGSDSVLSGHAGQREAFAAGRGKRPSDALHKITQILEQQRQHEQRTAEINSRLDALDRASARALREAEERLDRIRRDANRTIDGRIVFMDDDGTIYDEHGSNVDPDRINRDTWRPEAPSWSDFINGMKDVDDAKARHQEIQDLKGRLGDNPTDEDISEIDEELDALEAAMPASLATRHGESERSTSAAKLYDGDTATPSAVLRDPFESAVTPSDPTETGHPAITPAKPAAPI